MRLRLRQLHRERCDLQLTHSTAFEPAQRDALVTSLLDAHAAGYELAVAYVIPLVAELGLCGWLIVKGLDLPTWQRSADAERRRSTVLP